MKNYDFNPRNLPNELLQAIGLLVASSAYTESIVDQGITGLLGLDWAFGLIVTTHLTMPQRFQMLETAAKRRIADPVVLGEFEVHIKKLNDAFDRRNRIVHQAWCCDPTSGELYLIKTSARKELKMEIVAIVDQKVPEDAQFMYQVGVDLYSFLGLNGLLPCLCDQLATFGALIYSPHK